jgi:hypothetical protein
MHGPKHTFSSIQWGVPFGLCAELVLRNELPVSICFHLHAHPTFLFFSGSDGSPNRQRAKVQGLARKRRWEIDMLPVQPCTQSSTRVFWILISHTNVVTATRLRVMADIVYWTESACAAWAYALSVAWRSERTYRCVRSAESVWTTRFLSAEDRDNSVLSGHWAGCFSRLLLTFDISVGVCLVAWVSCYFGRCTT